MYEPYFIHFYLDLYFFVSNLHFLTTTVYRMVFSGGKTSDNSAYLSKSINNILKELPDLTTSSDVFALTTSSDIAVNLNSGLSKQADLNYDSHNCCNIKLLNYLRHSNFRDCIGKLRDSLYLLLRYFVLD